MPTGLAARLACILSASWAIACGDPSPAPADGSAERKEKVLEFRDRQLVVEDSGQEPRRRLSYAGADDRRVRIGISFRDPEDEGEPSASFFVFGLDWRGRAPSKGPTTHDFAITSVEHPLHDRPAKKPEPPEMAKVTETLDAAFLRVRGSVQTEQGQPLQISYTRDLRLSPDIPFVLELFLVPLPQVDIGIGARWVVSNAKTNERRTYELIGLTDTSATIEFERTSPEQARSRLPLVRGRFELGFADPLPTRGELEFEIEFEIPGEPGASMYQKFELDSPN